VIREVTAGGTQKGAKEAKGRIKSGWVWPGMTLKWSGTLTTSKAKGSVLGREQTTQRGVESRRAGD
jgi:hypothetical protein